ncbi:legume-like lectin [Ochromonadaceae sp. CCMP2298]|nr:legume-like lectin [Ochromonadaceae sp. CCMP2298]
MSRYCLALLVLLMGQVCSEKMESFSFAAPFESTDLAGVRVVGDSWKTSGTTEVLKNFIRLTPDRQSKKGALWTRKPLGVPAFSAQLQFRISGQGRTFFGDGVALWITQHAYNVEGIVHGFTERFVGVGVIFDTFRNTEKPNAHR